MLKSLFPSTADPGSGDFSHAELIRGAGKLPQELRTPVANYLRSAPMFFAWMELTEDLMEGNFRVPGGSAINSDGTYYWRLDTAAYVEHYGMGVPEGFLRHVRARAWDPGQVDELRFLEIYEELEQIMKRHAAGNQLPRQTFYPQQEPEIPDPNS